MGRKWRWGVILDAGSSGTRLHVYRWKDPARVAEDASDSDLRRLPQLVTHKKWTKKIRPGVSTFAVNPQAVGPDHLKDLVAHAKEIIPANKAADTPIFLMATAGVRLLPKPDQDALLGEVCSYFRQQTSFLLPDCDTHIQVIPGETEGLYGWIASNYLLGGFDSPEKHAHGKGHHTYGFLDMGGASAQIAFAPNFTETAKHADDLKMLRLRTMNGAPLGYKVFTATWLGFGVNQARESYVKRLLGSYDGTDNDREIPDPCMPSGLRTTLGGAPVLVRRDDAFGLDNAGHVTLLGTGDFQECLRTTYPLLGKDAPCLNEPCLLNGQHVPAIDFDVNHFIGVSEYWHTTHGVFDKGDKAYDLHTYQALVENFCSRSWSDIEAASVGSKKGNHPDIKVAQEACFKASWLINVLHDGIGIPRIGLEHTPAHPGYNVSTGPLPEAADKGYLEPFKPVDRIDGIEVSWTLGKMLLYSAGQVKPAGDALPVGFGSNVDDAVPPDFQFAGSTWKNAEKAGDEVDDWGDTADDLLETAKAKSGAGTLLFLMLLVLFLVLLRKRERRLRLWSKCGALSRGFRGSPSRKGGRGFSLSQKLFGRGPSSYERVMEQGEADQFELGGSDSDTDHSDCGDGGVSGASVAARVGRRVSPSSAAVTSSSSGSSSNTSSGVGSGGGSGAAGTSLSTPKANMDRFEDHRYTSTRSASIDRAGLVVRTESREQPTAALNRSRTTSPTRQKSSLSWSGAAADND